MRLPRDHSNPLMLAREVLRDELTPRVDNLSRNVFLHPIRVPAMDSTDTIVYREGDA